MALTLLFTLGEDLYGLEIEAIQELIEDPVLHRVPGAKGVLVGALNFRGQILGVVDLPALLGYADLQRDNRLVVLTREHRALAFSVSAIERIVKLDPETLALQQPADHSDQAVRGRVELNDRAIRLLDTEDVFKQLETLFAE